MHFDVDCHYRFFFYVDDSAGKPALEDYQRRLLLGLPQVDPALEYYQKVLGSLYDHWDPICANSMASAAFEFVSGTVIESTSEVSAMDVRPTAAGWPKYLRQKSGLGPAAACAIFPKQTHPDISAFIQVLPDIDEFSCLANDILSFVPDLAHRILIEFIFVGSTRKSSPAKPRTTYTPVPKPR